MYVTVELLRNDANLYTVHRLQKIDYFTGLWETIKQTIKALEGRVT